MTPYDLVKLLLDCECSAEIHDGVLWLEDGRSFNLTVILGTKQLLSIRMNLLEPVTDASN